MALFTEKKECKRHEISYNLKKRIELLMPYIPYLHEEGNRNFLRRSYYSQQFRRDTSVICRWRNA